MEIVVICITSSVVVSVVVVVVVSVVVSVVVTKILATHYFKIVDGYVKEICEKTKEFVNAFLYK